jgi:SPP1 gp7 family putative phage head morphogenesis protein
VQRIASKAEQVHVEPLPFDEAQEFWAQKVTMTPDAFAALSEEAYINAFTVSGVARMDMLMDIAEAVDRAIDEGTTFAEFKKTIGHVIEAKGWYGERAWRLDNIFRTNVQTAYNTGRYKQMTDPAVTAARPFWRYSAVNDSRTRPTHAALDGKVFRHDHPFWERWYPPNGFRCRCSVDTLSQREVEREGLTVETEDPTGGLIEPRDPTTGARLPARPLMPDPGWDRNPARDAWEPDLTRYPPAMREQFEAQRAQHAAHRS